MFAANNKNSEKNKFRKPNILRKKPIADTADKADDVDMVKLVTKACQKSGDLTNIQFVDSAYRPLLISSKINLSPENTKINMAEPNTHQVFIQNTYDHSNNNGYNNTFSNVLELNVADATNNIMVVEEPAKLFVCTPTSQILVPVGSLVMSSEGIPANNKEAPAPIMFQCDFGTCTKQFPSKQKLHKHKARHNKTTCKAINLDEMACPAKKAGKEVACNQVFTAKEDLLNHLKTDHTLDDSLHSCAQCSRRFFWASGVRAHRRACGGGQRRTPLACPWEGCGRSFLQPCRLREHSRTHTGDRPYPCLHPNCGCSFRTASKLVRHARVHTGERRHTCTTCGALFSRAEHLREHASRHARAPRRANGRARAARTPTEPQIALSTQAEESTHEEATSAPLVETTDSQQQEKATTDCTAQGPVWGAQDAFLEPCDRLLQVEAEAAPLAEADEHERAAGESRAARTHCTWPLAPRAIASEPCTTLELSEGSESNASAGAVRSDLFLLGALTNDDSESGVARPRVCTDFEGGEASEVGDAGEAVLLRGSLDAELGLLDHPTIDLMQEELMFTDAVDGSSFHVLLLGDVKPSAPEGDIWQN